MAELLVVLSWLIVVVAYIFSERRVEDMEAKLKDMDASFELRWKADMRAIRRWQKATEKTMTWPDHADLCVWLMDRITELENAAHR